MSNILAFSNQKGGVGKTTSAVNVALSLAVSEIKTLLIDFDPQANATTGLSELVVEEKNNIYDAILGNENVKNCITKTSFSHLDIITSTNDLVGAEIELVGVMAREYQLKKALKNIEKKYDIIIIDCPPSLGILTINALTASDGVLIPVQTEYFALEGLAMLAGTIREVRSLLNPNLGVDGVLLTMHASTLLNQQVASEIYEHLPEFVIRPAIRRNIKLAEAPSHGVPIHLHDPNSNGGKDYQDVSSVLEKRWGLK